MSSKILEDKASYIKGDNIGQGAFGVVFTITIKSNNEIMAVKQFFLKKGNDTGREKMLEEMNMEFSILSKTLPYVVPAYESFHDKGKQTFYIMMKYFPNNLNDYILKFGRKLRFGEFFALFQNILEGT